MKIDKKSLFSFIIIIAIIIFANVMYKNEIKNTLLSDGYTIIRKDNDNYIVEKDSKQYKAVPVQTFFTQTEIIYIEIK